MFFLSLALLGQSISLDADTGAAARQCAAAFTLAQSNRDSVKAVSQGLYLGMVAAKAEPREDVYVFGQVMSGWGAGRKQAQQGMPGSTALIPLCDARFPLSRSTKPVALPADPDDRDSLCGAILLLFYAADGRAMMEGNGRSPAPRDDEDFPLAKNILERLTAAAVKRGYADINASKPMLGRALRAGVDIGNPKAISTACEQVPA